MGTQHVVVAGAGAMGSLFGGLLAEAGLQVTLLARREEHVRVIRERGLHIVGEGGERSVRLGAASSVAEIAPADIVLVQCKAHATRAVAESIVPLMRQDSVAVSFQNGLGNEEIIAEFLGREGVLGGLTSLGATLEAPGVVRSYAALPTIVGELAGGLSPRAAELATLLSAHGIPTTASADVMAEKWRKLMLNVAMSATSALTGLTIGEVASLPPLAVVARRAMDEAAAVAEACGVVLPQATRYAIFDGIVGSGAARNKTSMRRDIEAGRPCEVEAIYLSVIERGRVKGIATPTLEVLAALVLGVEAARAAG
jgi:2-dehydropantoate 2-reductase